MTFHNASLVSDNLDIWTTATEQKSGGRGGRRRVDLYGIQRLRPLIVDLAVRGKLTSQQPGDQPAILALAKLAKARQSKIESGQARKPKALEPLPLDLPPLPEGWAWTQLGTIAEINPLNSAADKLDASFVPMALISTRIDGAHGAEIRKWGEIRKGFTQFAEGDIGLAKITPCFENGKAAIFENLINGIGAGTTELHVARPWSADVNRRYLLLTMKTTSYLKNGEAKMTGTAGQKRLTRAYFESTPLSLPPLEEQERIVAKVDELMALCDALETQSVVALDAHQTLAEALLAALPTSTDAADLAIHGARLEANFDTLFNTEASVDALRQTILELAVRGKLVPQQADDEPASVMMRAIRESRSDGSSKQKSHDAIPRADEPFDLPKGWCWERFDNLIDPAFPIAYGVLVPGADQSDGVPFVRIGDLSINNPLPLPEKAISPTVDAQFPRTRLRGGEILMGVVGSIGKLGVAPASWAGGNIARAICRIVPSSLLNKEFILWLLQSRFMQDSFLDDTRTLAQPTLNIRLIRLAATPVPPFAEQERIVAKLDELMALCDSLQRGIAEASATKMKLADTIVERATEQVR